MCSCNKKKGTGSTTKYKVTYPNGNSDIKTSLVSAKLAAGKIPGAKYEPLPATA